MELPADLRGQAPPGWAQGRPRPMAWGPFAVDLPSGGRVIGGWLWQLDDTSMVFFDHDHDHQLAVTVPPEVVDGTVVVTTAEWGQLTIRPLTPEEDTLDVLTALHLA